jgi:ElaB/YqjD/DUF883 family membrane-anchored ribosome-binding protein
MSTQADLASPSNPQRDYNMSNIVAPTETVKDVNSETDYTAEKAKSGIDNIKSAVKNVANTAGDGAENAVETIKQTYHDAKDAAQQNFGDIERQIREKPVQATLIAAGVGFLVATLLTR